MGGRGAGGRQTLTGQDLKPLWVSRPQDAWPRSWRAGEEGRRPTERLVVEEASPSSSSSNDLMNKARKEGRAFSEASSLFGGSSKLPWQNHLRDVRKSNRSHICCLLKSRAEPGATDKSSTCLLMGTSMELVERGGRCRKASNSEMQPFREGPWRHCWVGGGDIMGDHPPRCPMQERAVPRPQASPSLCL